MPYVLSVQCESWLDKCLKAEYDQADKLLRHADLYHMGALRIVCAGCLLISCACLCSGQAYGGLGKELSGILTT